MPEIKILHQNSQLLDFLEFARVSRQPLSDERVGRKKEGSWRYEDVS